MKQLIFNPVWRSLVFGALGFLAAPVVPAIVLPYLTPFIQNSQYPRYDYTQIPIFYLFALQFSLLFGLPSFLILSKFKIANIWSAIAVGACIGGGWSVAFGGIGAFPVVFPSWTGSGAGAALVFWLIWQSAQPT